MTQKKLPQEEWEHCPYCDDVGTIVEFRTMVKPMDDAHGKRKTVETPEPEANYRRCSWCHQNPKSVYNQRKLLRKQKS